MGSIFLSHQSVSGGAAGRRIGELNAALFWCVVDCADLDDAEMAALAHRLWSAATRLQPPVLACAKHVLLKDANPRLCALAEGW